MIKLIDILREAISSYNSKATKAAVEKIINSNQQYEFILQANPNRIGNIDKIDSNEFIEKILIPTFKIKKSDISVIPPKTPPNTKADSPKGSTKYNMYEFPTENGQARIILSGGRNAGQDYEKSLFDQVKESAGKKINDIDNEAIRKLFTDLKIDPSKLSPNDIRSVGEKDTKRTPSTAGPTNIGKTIADIEIMYNKKPYYLSVKDKKGDYFYNGPNIPFITQQKESDKVILDKSKLGANPTIDQVFKIFGIDGNKIVNGLNDYISKKDTKSVKIASKKFDKEAIKNFLASSLGYGYYYVRQDGNSLKTTPILNKNKALDIIGDITDVNIKYPSGSNKSTEVEVLAKSNIGGDVKYIVDIRNSQGMIVPVSIKIKSKK
jgi:uncharacterized protein (DUF2164 family)